MPEYAAFLRAVNLGRARRVTGAELRSLFEGLGLSRVGTFRTSGNVVFAAGRGRPGELAARIESALAAELGYEVPVFLRTAAEVRRVAAHEPFPQEQLEATDGRLQVVLLAAPPGEAARRETLALATEEDRLAFGARELYWLPRGRMSDSALDPTGFERLLGPATVRTKGTLDSLAARYFGGRPAGPGASAATPSP